LFSTWSSVVASNTITRRIGDGFIVDENVLEDFVASLYEAFKPPRKHIECRKWGKINDIDSWIAPCPWHRHYLTSSLTLYRKSYGRRLGFGLLVLYGEQGGGKSTLALQTAHEIFCLIKRKKPLKKIIDKYTVFAPEKIKEKAMTASAKHRHSVIIGDDWGITASGIQWFEDRQFYIWMRKLMQVVRTRIANLIVTTANLKALMGAIAEQPGSIIGMVQPLGSELSVSIYYEFRMLPNGKTYIKKIGMDHYCVTFPDPIYDYYLKIRDSYVDYVLNQDSEPNVRRRRK